MTAGAPEEVFVKRLGPRLPDPSCCAAANMGFGRARKTYDPRSLAAPGKKRLSARSRSCSNCGDFQAPPAWGARLPGPKEGPQGKGKGGNALSYIRSTVRGLAVGPHPDRPVLENYQERGRLG